MRGLASGGLTLLVAVALVACGSGDEPTTAATEADSAASARVEALELEKEKAELETEKAELEAQKEKQRAEQARAVKREAEAASQSEPETEPEEASEPPNVVGLPLPAAEQQLDEAGYSTAAVNTDTLFGIVNKDNYTICKQDPPRGTVVKVLAQKYGC